MYSAKLLKLYLMVYFSLYYRSHTDIFVPSISIIGEFNLEVWKLNWTHINGRVECKVLTVTSKKQCIRLRCSWERTESWQYLTASCLLWNYLRAHIPLLQSDKYALVCLEILCLLLLYSWHATWCLYRSVFNFFFVVYIICISGHFWYSRL